LGRIEQRRLGRWPAGAAGGADLPARRPVVVLSFCRSSALMKARHAVTRGATAHRGGNMHRLSGLCGLILLLSCSTSVHAEAILVSAAGSLSNAFKEIGEDFQRDHPGYRVEFNFAGSGVLLQQLDGGAPVDVFASPDQHTMDQA